MAGPEPNLKQEHYLADEDVNRLGRLIRPVAPSRSRIGDRLATMRNMGDSGSNNRLAEATVDRLRREGDPALAELFALHRPRLRRMVEVRMDDRVAGRVDPSDVLQEVFLDASRQLPAYLAGRPMPPFLWLRFLTAQRLMATHRHHLGTQMRDAKLEVSLDGPVWPSVCSESLSRHLVARLTPPSRAAAKIELRVRLREALEAMEPLDREILSLRHFEELSNNEVAQELGISKAAASNRYMRALGRLGKLLSGVSGGQSG